MKKIGGWLQLKSLWPLYIILAVQAILTLHRITSRAVYGDEALYRWAGWMQDPKGPTARSYFSGAPQIYPRLDALIGSLGGARTLSLLFMLGATIMLWLTAKKLLGRNEAIAACALFACIAPTALVGSLATFDAMSLFLLTAATFLAVHSGWRWLAACCAVLALANVTKYASILWDPVVVGLILIRSGWQKACATLAGTAAAIVIFLEVTGDMSGAVHTTFSRPAGHDSATTILWSSATWAGIIIALAVAGTIIAFSQKSKQWVIALCTAAALLAPLEQARIHTLTSLDKHVDFGAWFGTIAAGYAVVKIASWLRARSRTPAWAAGMTCTALLIPVLALSVNQFNHPIYGTHDVRMVSLLRKLVPGSRTGFILVDSPIPEHVIPPIAPIQNWLVVRRSTPEQQQRQIMSDIRAKRIALVVLGTGARSRNNPLWIYDQEYMKLLRSVHAYHLIRSGHPFYVWKRVGSARPLASNRKAKSHHRRARRSPAPSPVPSATRS